ncbi:hypothetical protein PYW07_001438 [Mythimna separata]|uniref:Uncharacterized protein n=1 Tax=Mythimna separata TaxID=271217 RepID=A0AAD7YUD9_MYTSE|nr:hypothetical protein PYW07_001438 [Mythimna separata]
MSSDAYDTLRLILVASTVVVRLALMPRQLQAYLDMAQRRLDVQKKEAGRITNIDLQKKVTSQHEFRRVRHAAPDPRGEHSGGAPGADAAPAAGLPRHGAEETGHAYDTLRLILVASTVVVRLALMPRQLQAYLDMAQRRLDVQKKEAGRITNIDLQKKIASVFYYLCVVALQYICPIIMCLYMALMYKTLGGYSWTALFYESDGVCAVEDKAAGVSDSVEGEGIEQFQLAWENLKMVFTVDVYRGVFGFATWWCCFAWFLTTSLGLGYQTYFRIS